MCVCSYQEQKGEGRGDGYLLSPPLPLPPFTGGMKISTPFFFLSFLPLPPLQGERERERKVEEEEEEEEGSSDTAKHILRRHKEEVEEKKTTKTTEEEDAAASTSSYFPILKREEEELRKRLPSALELRGGCENLCPPPLLLERERDRP